VPAFELNILKNTIAVGLFGVTLLIPGLRDFGNLDGGNLAKLGISAILGITIADTCFLKALNLLGAGRNAVLDCLYSPFVIVLAILFLGESFGLVQALGFILIVGGVILATSSSQRDPISRPVLRRGLAYGVASMFFMAAGVVISKPILADTSPIAVSAWRLLIGLLGGIVWMLLSGRTRRSMAVFRGPLPWRSLTMGSLLGSWLALMIWMAGFKYTEASTASVLNQTSVIFVVILAAVFLHEPIGWKKVTGMGFGFAGIAILFLLAG